MRTFRLVLSVNHNYGPFDIFYNGNTLASLNNGSLSQDISATDLLSGIDILVPLDAYSIDVLNKKKGCENYQHFNLILPTPTITPTITLTPPPTPTLTPTLTPTPTTTEGCVLTIGVSDITCEDVTITEPARPAYYYSNNHPPSYYDDVSNLPIIYTNESTYDPNDLVWLENSYLKVGLNLKRGGQITYLSKAGSTHNMINNAIDGGRQIQLDATQLPGNSYVPVHGGTVAPPEANLPHNYNTTMGGDYVNNCVTMIDYHPVPNGYYTKVRPILYTAFKELAEVTIATTYTLIDNCLKVEYYYHSFRTDGQYTDDGGFDGAAVPACFVIDTLNYYKLYKGTSPWTNQPTEGGKIPITVPNGETVMGDRPTENWLYVYNPSEPSNGFGLYNPVSNLSVIKQLYPDGLGEEYSGGFTYLHTFEVFNTIVDDVFLPITNRDNFNKTMTAYLSLGSESEVRSKFYQIHSTL